MSFERGDGYTKEGFSPEVLGLATLSHSFLPTHAHNVTRDDTPQQVYQPYGYDGPADPEACDSQVQGHWRRVALLVEALAQIKSQTWRRPHSHGREEPYALS